MNSLLSSSKAQRGLSMHIRTLWLQLKAALTARRPQGTHAVLLRRLRYLHVWQPDAEASLLIIETLPMLIAGYETAQDPEVRMQTLSDCLRLLHEASGEYRSAQQKLVEQSRQMLSSDVASVRLMRCVVVLCVDVAETMDESAVIERYWHLEQIDIDEQLGHWLQQQISMVVEGLATTDGEPPTLTAILMRACRRLSALLRLQENETGVRRWCSWQIALCCAHFCRRPFSADKIEALFLDLFCVIHCEAESSEIRPPVRLPSVIHETLSQLSTQLHPDHVSAAQLRQCYELSVLTTQLADGSGAQILRSLHACMAQHWSLGAPMSAAAHALLQDICNALRAEADLTLQAHLMWRLSELWPEATRADLAIPLADGSGEAAHSVRLDAVPVLLAGGLGSLTAVRQEWFESWQSYARHRDALQRELLLLERGAAAVRVRSVERYSGQLLELLSKLDLLTVSDPFPGALLWRAMQHLVNLLDAAAAWREALPDPVLMQALQDYSSSVLERSALPQVAEPVAGSTGAAWTQLGCALTQYVESLNEVLQIRMRLEVQRAEPVLSAAVCALLHQVLQPLLRFVLLDFSLSLERRRLRHLPLTGCLWLRVVEPAAPFTLELRDDAAREPPPPEQWQQLQRHLRKCGVVELQCRETSLGRCFALTLTQT